jgi:cytochrome c oxidase subunit I
MASIAAPTHASHAAAETQNTGIWSWITTTDHKRIGTLYLWTALFFFIVGGFEATLIRTQLMKPNMGFVSAETYNHDDGVPRRHAPLGRVLQLPDSAPDRRA